MSAMKMSFFQSAAVLLTLSVIVLGQSEAQARGGHGGGHRGAVRAVASAPRPVSVGHGSVAAGSRMLARMGFGRGRGRRGYYSGNYGPDPDQAQAETFAQRQSQNPYASVPQHINVSNYIKTY